jgi:23S rRNA (adenine2503-C2)-methyltransferase
MPIDDQPAAAPGPPGAAPEPASADLLGIPRPRLAEILAPVVDRRFRVDQIYRALYDRGVCDFAEMTELGKALRQRLAERFRVELPEIASRRESADGTVKYLLRLADGASVETVDIPDGGRRTVCVSSQAGCALACRFCVTGYWGGGRNLTAGEILAQVLIVRRHKPGEASPPAASGAEAEAEKSAALTGLNLVFMGMGEPLLNLDNLRAALDILLERISKRRITVSTAGVIPGIEAMARWQRRPRLAISLHAPDDDRRSEIMPINKKYPLPDLIGTLRRYPLDPRDHLTFEYLLIRGFNDAPGDADAVAGLLRGLRAKVNLIPLNPDPVLGELRPPGAAGVQAFRQRLVSRGLVATVRQRRGDDVSAACGQLRAPEREPRGFPPVNLDSLPAR